MIEMVTKKIESIREKIDEKERCVRAWISSRDHNGRIALPSDETIREIRVLTEATNMLRDLVEEPASCTEATIAREIAKITKSILVRLASGTSHNICDSAAAEYVLCLEEILEDTKIMKTEGITA